MSKLIILIYRYIFAREVFYKFNYGIYKLSLRGMGILNYESIESSGELYFLNKILSKKSTNFIIFDVGANIGDFSLYAAQQSLQVKVYAFEPHPTTYKKLLCNTANDKRISTYNVGVGEKESEIILYDYADNDGSSHASLYKGAIEEIRDKKSIEHKVKVISLYDFIKEQKIENIDLLKIDTEGNEMNVLLGLKDLISGDRVKVILFEINEMNVFSRVFFKDYFDLLDNYQLFRLLPKGMIPIDKYKALDCEIFAYQNIVAINNGS